MMGRRNLALHFQPLHSLMCWLFQCRVHYEGDWERVKTEKKNRDNVCLAVITRLFDYRGLNKGGVMLPQQMVDLFDPL